MLSQHDALGLRQLKCEIDHQLWIVMIPGDAEEQKVAMRVERPIVQVLRNRVLGKSWPPGWGKTLGPVPTACSFDLGWLTIGGAWFG